MIPLFQWSLPVSDPVAVFALLILIILVVPPLFVRLKVPGIIGLILAGVLVGPNAAGVLERDAAIQLFGAVGLLYIMFVAGLEINLVQFARYRNRSLVFGSISFLIPFTVSTLASVILLGYSWPSALLIGSMLGSHTLLAYPIAGRFGITKSAPVTTTVGGTIVTDLSALLVLAVVAGSVRGNLDVYFWLRLAFSLGVYVAFMFLILPRIAKWFFRSVREESAMEYIFVLAAVFISAVLSTVAGLQPIIGAFLAGLALNRLIPEQSTLMNRILFVGNSLFIPVFLISVGMLVDLRAFAAGLDVWTMSIFLTGTVVLAKFLAADATRRLFHYTRDEGFVIFGLSVAQAAATLAIVFVGFELQILNDAVLNGAVVMILVTCLIASVSVDKYGRKVALAEEAKPYDPGEAPQRILVPLSNPATAEALMSIAFLTRSADSREPIHPLIVTRDGPNVEADVAAGEKLLGHAVVHATAADVPVQPINRIDMNPADGIQRAIRELRISHVVVGWNGQVSRRRRVFGSVLDQMLSETRVQILVCKISKPVNTVDRVLFVVPPNADREPGFLDALRTLKRLAHQLTADLLVIAAAPDIHDFKPHLLEQKPEVPTRLVGIENWASMWSTLNATVKESDLIVVLSAREGAVSWRPMLNRLPGRLSQQLPDADFLLLYPSERLTSGSSAVTSAQIDLAQRILVEKCVTQDVRSSDKEGFLKEVLVQYFGDREEDVHAILADLMEASDDDATELEPGVALFHCRTKNVTQPALLIGINRAGATFPSVDDPVHVLLILLNPPSITREGHLSETAVIAAMVSGHDIVETLLNVGTAAEACALLHTNLLSGRTRRDLAAAHILPSRIESTLGT